MDTKRRYICIEHTSYPQSLVSFENSGGDSLFEAVLRRFFVRMPKYEDAHKTSQFQSEH